MRVLILAFDGLEVSLVRKWHLASLKQQIHGVYKAAISPRYKKPHTPSAWATIITGLPPEQHKIDDWWTYGSILDKIRYLPPFKWIKNKRKILWKLGLKPRTVEKKDYRVTTIFDVVNPSIALFVPTVNEPRWIHEEYNKAFEKGIDHYIAKIWEIHKYRKQQFFEKLNGDWKLFMAWFDVADLLGHVCIVKCQHELRKAYLDLGYIVYKTKQIVDEKNTAILVISDHGMQPMPDGTGDHTFYGFWSLNHEISWFNPRKATDFYNLILRLVGYELQ